MWPNAAANCPLVSRRRIRDHPDLVVQIIRTHINATDYANAHTRETAAIYANRIEDNLSTIEYSIRTWDGEWISDPHVEIPSALEYATVDYQLNYTSRQLSEGGLFNTSLYDKVRTT
jgi:NitT/TauT family transport system substrate-binding protein